MVQTIMFLPGGSGSETSGQFAWNTFLAGDARVANYRVLIPYTEGNQLIDEGPRAFKTLDAVLSCYGGDPARVHVAGFSNGGRMAFWFMLVRPDRFVTLLGAPGLFPSSTPEEQAAALGERPVFNGVGELDDEWRPSVKATHDALVAAGANSIYVEFPGEGHRPSDAFDESVLFDFWGSH
jgi:predicted esterase